ncbi:cellulose synthase-like protein B3 [Daucus carota subsp. sativus]|uniref:cellulose synthase-like protein B3 n=1 Tax=Daucus carota subsp. sativus TaxID=79200 RepID=UPI003083DD5F
MGWRSPGLMIGDIGIEYLPQSPDSADRIPVFKTFIAPNQVKTGHGLEEIQGPTYGGTNCFYTRKVIYKLSPDITHWRTQ